MAVSREFLQQLTAAADIVQIVGERVSLQKRGNNYFGLCPFHNEKTPSFSVNPSKGFYHCFGCGANGDALRFVVQTTASGDFMAGVEFLAQRTGMTVPRGGADDGTEITAVMSSALAFYRAQYQKTSEARKYLEQRGISADTVERFQIGYAPDGWDGAKNALASHGAAVLTRAGILRKREGDNGDYYDYFRRRIMFPILESEKRVIGFGGRALDDSEPAKYLNSPDIPRVFSKKYAVFGMAQARAAARTAGRVIITEGYMDAIMLSQAGFGESVAAMGTALTAQQMQKIARMADNIVLAFDGDDAGQKAAWRSLANILPSLRDGMNVSFLFLPQGEDPDGFIRKNGADAFSTMIRDAASLGDYMVSHLWGDKPAGDAASSAALSEGQKLARLINAENAPFLRALMEQRLAEKAKISPDVVRRREKPKTPSAKSKWRMRQEGLLFRLLCCVAANPKLIEDAKQNPPLLGEEVETEIVAATLHYLRWRAEEDDANVIAYLRGEGYDMLAVQIAEVARQYAAGDPGAEFAQITGGLTRERDKKIRGSGLAPAAAALSRRSPPLDLSKKAI